MLSEKQQRFADLMGTPGITAAEAYRRAGYKAKGHASEVNASRLLKNAEVQAAIEARRQQAAKAVGVTAERVAAELARIAFADLRKLYREDGSLKPPGEWTDEEAAIVAALDIDDLFEGTGENRFQKGHTRKVKRWDKVRALELLGKHLGMFIERHEHSGNINHGDLSDAEIEARIAQLQARANGTAGGASGTPGANEPVRTGEVSGSG